MEISQKKIEKLVIELIDEQALPIVKLIIQGIENVSEFKIAEDLEISINQVRNILYKLQKHNLISSTRKKDKKKGWYVYYYTFNFNHANSLYKSLQQNKIISLKEQIQEEESNNFYVCPKNCKKLPMEEALSNNFQCPDCNRILKESNSKKEIKELQKRLIMLQEEPIKAEA